MPKVTFITEAGESITIDNAVGTLMEIATENDVEGIDGNCGGVCSCSTCHVKVKPEWLEKVGPAGETEQDLLNFEDVTNERSRLSCQIEMCAALDGLVVEVQRL
ncbi:MAG: 2Fe-2S iron-sulfur cluster-binding protein [Akkermansiaceae bacterium]